MPDVTSRWSGEEFEVIQGVIRQANNDIDGHLNAMETYAESQMADWIAESKEAYWIHKAEWDKAITEMNQILTTKAAPTLNNIHMNYDGNERSMTKAWTG
jgi:uncharacterized protein YukE